MMFFQLVCTASVSLTRTSVDRQLEQGEAVSGVEYADARIRREKLCGHIKAMFADNDIDVIRTTIWIPRKP